MSLRMPPWCVGTAMLLVAACADNPLAPPPAPQNIALSEEGPECDNERVDQPCDDEPSGGGWRFFGLPDAGVYEAPGDPSPGAAGMWLGDAVVPERCYAERYRYVTDGDADWLDDTCELELAKAFAPRLHFSGDEPCPGGQPYWAVKYFPSTGHVRLAYMPAYYEDCGYWFAHIGDSEFITIDARFNGATRHWQMDGMWLSAHYQAGWGTDRSEWSSATQAEFRYRPLTHPTIHVARRKHANYRSIERCTRGWSTGDPAYSMEDECADGGWPEVEQVRFPVLAHRNVGSRHVDLVGLVMRDGAAAGSRTEGFYAWKTFGGWIRADGAKAYRDLLVSDKFEQRGTSWGPGPSPPNWNFTTSISGPGALPEYSTGTWTASSINASGPVSYAWYLNGGFWHEGETFELWVAERGTWYTIAVIATDASGQTSRAETSVYVTGSDGELDDPVDDPGDPRTDDPSR